MGDIVLMLPHDRVIAGLISFPIAHLAYLAAFVLAAVCPWSGTSVLPRIPLLGYGVVLFAILRPHLGPLLVPVLVSMIVIPLGTWRASEYARQYPPPGPRAAALGALLFVVSDSALAISRFARPCRAVQPLALGTYFVAQWPIAPS